MISEFVVKGDAVRFASKALDSVPLGFFVKVGKREEKGLTVYWVMVPVVENVREDGRRPENESDVLRGYKEH